MNLLEILNDQGSDEFTSLYGDLCDAVERAVYGPYDDEFMHTSKEARAAAVEIVRRLEKYV